MDFTEFRQMFGSDARSKGLRDQVRPVQGYLRDRVLGKGSLLESFIHLWSRFLWKLPFENYNLPHRALRGGAPIEVVDVLAEVLGRGLRPEERDHHARPCVQCKGWDNYFAEMWSSSEEGSYVRLIDFCITQL